VHPLKSYQHAQLKPIDFTTLCIGKERQKPLKAP